MLADVPAAQWRDYLAFHAIDDASNALSKPFQDENFAFYGQTLNGQPEQRVRWKRVLEAVNGGMGEALGQLYVKDYFPPEAKARAQQLVDNVRNALKARIEGLDWMSDETKAKALEKWSTFLPKIGYPDKWRGWDGLEIKPDGYFANLRAANAFNNRYDLDKIGKPTDRYEWNMTPQTVNAYYSSGTNTINFPAAILQPPFFYADGDDAINYGGIGAVIGHEAGHGFDDSGSQFDGAGNNVNWWTQQDRDRFEQRTAKLAAQFDAYVPLADHPDNHVNGKLTHGREHRRPRRPQLRLRRPAGGRWRQARPDDRRPDPRPAFLPQLGPGLARQHPRQGAAGAAQHRSAFAGQVPRDRRAFEHARLRRRVPVQGRGPDGAWRGREGHDLVSREERGMSGEVRSERSQAAPRSPLSRSLLTRSLLIQ